MEYTKKNKLAAKNMAILSTLLFLFMISFPLQVKAENTQEEKMFEQNSEAMPSFGGKLDLTPQKQEDIAAEKEEQKENLKNEKIANENQSETPLPEKKDKNPQTKREDIILAPQRSQHSVIIQENGSNVMIVHGSKKAPENYTNSTNVNNGFYMNITNPDGSGMNMGTYFNSNSNSNSPRKQSRAQIIVDKME